MSKQPDLNTEQKEPMTNTPKGILMPQLAYRFRVLFSDHTVNNITQQIEKCELSYTDKTCKLTIRQPERNSDMHHYIKTICEMDSTDIHIEHLDGKGNISHVVILRNSKVMSHTYELAYGDDAYAVHMLIIAYRDIDTGDAK